MLPTHLAMGGRDLPSRSSSSGWFILRYLISPLGNVVILPVNYGVCTVQLGFLSLDVNLRWVSDNNVCVCS